MSMEHARRRAMWFNGCNRYKGNNDNEQNQQGQAIIAYFTEKKEAERKRTPEEIEAERLYYTSTR